MLVRQGAAICQGMAALEASQEIGFKSRMQDRLGWLHNSGANGLVKDRSLALDPMFRPAHGGIGSITVPDPRKQDDQRAGIDDARLARVLAFEDARTLRDEKDLIELQSPPLRPFEMMVCWMPGGGILGVGLYPREAD